MKESRRRRYIDTLVNSALNEITSKENSHRWHNARRVLGHIRDPNKALPSTYSAGSEMRLDEAKVGLSLDRLVEKSLARVITIERGYHEGFPEKAYRANPRETPIDQMHLSTRAYNALAAYETDYQTAQDLADAGLKNLLGLKGIGPTSAREIKKELERLGLRLKN